MERLCLHTITTKPWGLEKAIDEFQQSGITGITVWQDAAQSVGIRRAAGLLSASNLEVISYCRGGFFASTESVKREKAINDNKQMIEEAAQLNAPILVLVCGADPEQSMEASRAQIIKGIEAILPLAEDLQVKLAIEPLHPVYADTRSAINTMATANDICEKISSDWLGVAVDVYHIWWDPDLKNQILRCGRNNHLFAYHICDWKVPTTDILLDRGIMGEGCIDLKEIDKWVAGAGFKGYREVEIFSTKYWEEDQKQFLQSILTAYNQIYSQGH